MKIKLTYSFFLFLFLTVWNTNAQIKYELYETEIFQIKYPIDWSLSTSKDLGAVFSITSPIVTETDSFSENVNLIIQDIKGQNVNLDTYVSMSKNQLSSLPNSEIFTSIREERNGIVRHIITFSANLEERNLKGKQVYIIKNEKVFVITFIALEKDYNVYVKTADIILNSFKVK